MSSPKRRKTRSDVPLTADEDAALNRAFYAADPADYLNRRIRSLIFAAESSDAENRRDERVARYGKMEITVPSASVDPPDERGYQRYVLLETEMLVHHTAETLLRMFLGHRGNPYVPWLEVVKLRAPGAYPRELKSMSSAANAQRLREDIGHVWLGNGVAPAGGAEAKWNDAVDRLRDYVLQFAMLSLSRSGAYNAVKHGLAVQPAATTLKLHGVAGLSADGPSLAWLHRTAEGRMVVRNRWLNADRDMALAGCGQRMLRSLWDIARTRYLGWPNPEEVFVPVPLVTLMEHSASGDERTSGLSLEEVDFPPSMFSPPGSGADGLAGAPPPRP